MTYNEALKKWRSIAVIISNNNNDNSNNNNNNKKKNVNDKIITSREKS